MVPSGVPLAPEPAGDAVGDRERLRRAPDVAGGIRSRGDDRPRAVTDEVGVAFQLPLACRSVVIVWPAIVTVTVVPAAASDVPVMVG